MNLKVTERAASFYQKEMQLQESDGLYFYLRVGGMGSGGFSAGVTGSRPDIDYETIQTGGITVYIAETDRWYFDGMTIDYDPDIGDIVFHEEGTDLSFKEAD
ncbi:HesB/YadR/YfhF family protein [Alkalicoccus urumqiensis]|uniref:Core domain-containing protein n=1 Tax=Alkalicoccus urumqiensis TaxID=1548213 RepID=A0A2P6MDR2_ALKUR|nr:iron-sulfur cluster biosynthesis family protein [Alkalicoccus urumqiensis]PRO64425.1 hypothetical protein C6I21_14575 [Alkalicoccus urumqiensis]